MSPRRRWALSALALALGLALLPSILTLLVAGDLPFGVPARFAINGKVRAISWRHLDVAGLGWGPLAQETVTVGAARAEYSVGGLLRRQVDGLLVSGLTIHLVNGEGGLRLRGCAPLSGPDATPAQSGRDWRLPLGLGRLDIRQGLIVIHAQGAAIAVPFALHLEAVAGQPAQLQFVLDLLPEIQGATVKGESDLGARTVLAAIACRLPLPAVTQFWPTVAGQGLTGEVNINAQLRLDDKGGAVSGTWGQVIIPPAKAAALLAEAASASGEFAADLTAAGGWRLTASGVVGAETAKGLALNGLSGRMLIAPLHLGCQGQGQGLAGKVDLLLTTERITLADVGLEVGGLTVKLPWQWPAPAAASPATGSVIVNQVKAQGKILGGMDLTVQQDRPLGCRFKGTVHSTGAAKYALALKGDLGLDPERHAPEFNLLASLPALKLKGLRLGEFIDLREEVELDGTLQAEAVLRGTGGRREARAEISIAGGRLAIAKQGVEITGIKGGVHFPDFLARHGATAAIDFQQAKLAGLVLSDGSMTLHQDGDGSLFVEQAKAGWSAGTIHAMGLRLSPGRREARVDLYCDRLNLAQVFTQLGTNQLSGQGAVNGRLPLVYKDGRFSVKQGFLYSTPGGGGEIRMAARDLITAGVPAGTPQFGQLEFAAAALQDFVYNWLTIGLDSQGDTLALAMTVDGRPAQALPFRYDARQGTFTRLTAAGEVGLNQPIRLDVNFRLPFKDVLGYGKGIKALWEQTR